MKLLKPILLLCSLALLSSCGSDKKKPPSPKPEGKQVNIEHASGFSITEYDGYRIVDVNSPWPDAEKSFSYLLVEEGAELPEDLDYDHKIQIPVQRMVVTSTTHISSLELLDEEEVLVGFPGLDHISSENTRKRIAEGEVQELGANESLNTEILLNLEPDVVVGFALDGSNKTFRNAERSGIPVVYNSDWMETSPLGKAEWIKFFGAFLGKSEQAAEFFEEVTRAYQQARQLAEASEKRPTVLSGSMYKDQWHLPRGDSWHAQFIKDANAQYAYADIPGTGSLSLSIESVLAKAQDAEFWVGPAQFRSYAEMQAASPHYAQFEAFQQRNVYTYSSERGPTGGVIFYELAPNRPDLVLQDLISIFHPELLPDYEPSFYKPLKEE